MEHSRIMMENLYLIGTDKIFYMKHYLRDLFLAGLALLALSSCHSADPEKEAEKLNEQFTELINSIDTNASPYTRYKYLLKIKDTADSLFSKGRTGFKRKNWPCIGRT